MAGNKALQKFKDSKIPKKGKGKVIIEIPIYKEPNTQSTIIGKLSKNVEINWISKSICDEREWIRCDEKNNFGYIVGYEKDGKCNIDISSIKEIKEKKKKENNFEIKINENIPITKEEIILGDEALREILTEDDKKKDKDDDSKNNSTGIEENYFDFGNKSDASSIEENKSKTSEIKIQEENWDNFFEDDVSKIDFVKYENDKLMNEILCKFEEENKQLKEENKSHPNDKDKEKNDENSVYKALSSIIDVLPGNENLSKKDNLMDALNLIPGGKKEDKKEKKDKKDKKEEDNIRKSKTIGGKGKNNPKNFSREGADFKQALKDAKRMNNKK